ncbi:MAG: alkyl sulfatase dimerization domain-containing protein [Pseudomonadota bacterium]
MHTTYSYWLLSLLLFLTSCGSPDTEPVAADTPDDEAMRELTHEFRQRVEQVADGVWVAVGFGLANSILIEGTDGLIVIDTMETLEAGLEVANRFRALSDKPLAAIIYTHNHADHVFGAQSFVDVLAHPGRPVEVFGHETTAYYVHRIVSEFRPIISARSYRMFGTKLDRGAQNDGIGISLRINEESDFGFIEPTRTFSDTLLATVAGLEIRLLHAPGETNDQLFVWIESMGLLAVGDNLYRAFPNLYTIRGTPHRSVKQWANSLDLARSLPVDLLVPSHGSAIKGREHSLQILTDYRDAIRFVYDQTVRYMNQGYTPDEAVAAIELPPHLAKSPYLRELYGKIEWSVKAVYAGNLGWFDGNPSTLRPLPPLERAQHVQALAGGFDALTTALANADERGEHQWVLELSDHVLRLDPTHEAARSARVRALIARGQNASNPNERQYYLSSALELRDGVRFTPLDTSSEVLLAQLPMTTLFDSLSVNLRAEDVLETEIKVNLFFTDTEQWWSLWVRRGVLEVKKSALEGADIEVHTDEMSLKRLLGGKRNVVAALATDFDFPVGNALAFGSFLKLFAPERKAPEPAPFAAN